MCVCVYIYICIYMYMYMYICIYREPVPVSLCLLALLKQVPEPCELCVGCAEKLLGGRRDSELCAAEACVPGGRVRERERVDAVREGHLAKGSP